MTEVADEAARYLAEISGDDEPEIPTADAYLRWRNPDDAVVRIAESVYRFDEWRSMRADPAIVDLRIPAVVLQGTASLELRRWGHSPTVVHAHEKQFKSARATHRALWFVLTVLGTAWGFISGLSFAGKEWIDPGSAVFGMLAIVVLGLTMNQVGKRRH